ncbi:integrase [Mycoavidus cysteinexigens]|uniref:Integrase n=1 Tax=Mycoavidus cysteinexigens TaxID=1553431 RepID=A0A2Z6ESB2_9BURK|nr:integrase arm-type DNA-binding domain-containing protein [Mycoavidus cysteinexigens]BBE08297.1 integrase [Mycoavidus cysteinexigens]GAM53000.1 integrase [bacterium endosymbiont of Mortierella elongata FMR23-6]GLR00803.1 integrase [Mycoavidus cysteinexigens]
MALTDTVIRNTKPTAKPIKLTDSGGLVLLVQPNAARWWRLRYRFAGKEKMLSLGTYPNVSLKDARLLRDQAKSQLAKNIDPSLARQEAKLTKTMAFTNSFEAVARQWWTDWRGTKSPSYAECLLRRLEVDIFPVIGSRPVTEITAPLLLMAIKKIEARGALDIAKRAFQTCGQVMRYAIAHGLAERNPAAEVRPSDVLKPAKKTNYARLNAKELPELLRKIDAYDGQPLTRLAMQLMALTFVRTGELIGAQWSEFEMDAKVWRIPAERMKMRTPHIVPLSKQSIAVLEQIYKFSGGKTLLFPSERGYGKPMSNNTILYALYRMGYHSRMTGHGFRGIASTILHEQGYPHDHIELQLAHQERNAVSASYNHALYLKQRTEMMQAWADYLTAMKASEESSNGNS